ncbi:MAG TPA: alpha-1,4 polygalactosaminidase [Gammaproteobacteria bacterium]|nr:alpha-1,4 polygalactosaminidase [Gammaproteobacteria bacterium]
MNDEDSTAIVTPLDTRKLAPGANWQPEIGAEARGIVERKLPGGAGDAVLDAAASILGRGVSPGQANDQKTGLVVGYVQSGKTLSFTTVMALARDNGYQLVVVIAGISKPLLNQSTQRLRKDLMVDDVDGHLRWVTYTNPVNNENNRRYIQQALDEWRDPQVPENERATILITVMKNYRHLENLIALLRRLNLDHVPTLIVDDEADQASLNTLVNRGRESTTYRRLLELRDAAPCHTFLQYTATPQAPLLINIIDSLSPEFVEVLEPGDDYVGGESFFGGMHDLVCVIPPQDIPSDNNPLAEPPPSLLDSLRVFLVGVAAGLIQGRSRENANRSMLVHPSQKTAQHLEYRVWIGRIFDEWQRLLELLEGDTDRRDLMDDFREAYDDVLRTVPDLSSFDEISRMLVRAFRLTSIEEINARAGTTPTVDWSRAYGWILVGGQAMDRGFTVEGLAVTYMPRGPGVGNADTVQQRARFFGYKRPYLGFCRIYLEQDVLNALEEYVTHEEEMRRQLQQLRDEGQPLVTWKRAFVLSPDLRPCRNNVIRYDYARGSYANKWFAPRVVLTPQVVTDENRDITQSFLDTLDFGPDEGSPEREPAQIHDISREISLVQAIESLLVPFRFTAPGDTQEITGVLLQLSHALEQNIDETCVVYRMSPGYTRSRSVDVNGKVRNLFQGAAPVNPPALRGTVYPGDRSIHEPEDISIQIHFVELTQNKEVVARAVPVIAVWVPRRFELPWVVQDQPQ